MILGTSALGAVELGGIESQNAPSPSSSTSSVDSSEESFGSVGSGTDLSGSDASSSDSSADLSEISLSETSAAWFSMGSDLSSDSSGELPPSSDEPPPPHSSEDPESSEGESSQSSSSSPSSASSQSQSSQPHPPESSGSEPDIGPPKEDKCPETTANPVRYSSGQLEFVEVDLQSSGFGFAWGHSRSYANILALSEPEINGHNWLVQQLGRLLFQGVAPGNNNPLEICLVTGGTSSLWFSNATTGSGFYRPLFSGFESLTHDNTNHTFFLTETSGRVTTFFDNSVSVDLAGRLKSVTDPGGQVTTAEYNLFNRFSAIEQTDGTQVSRYEYAYDSATGFLESVTLLVNTVAVRRASYNYHTGLDSQGNSGDLKAVLIEQNVLGSTWIVIEQNHYRYYLGGGEEPGFVHGLKYAVRGSAYQSMLEAGLNPQTASDEDLAGYADFYFEYDDIQRVSVESIDGGRRLFTLDYKSNPAATLGAVNVWATRTIEGRPDGTENRVYCNKAGKTLLSILRQSIGGDILEWFGCTTYNSQFDVVNEIDSYAIDSVVEPTEFDPSLTINLKQNEGLIRANIYYTNTDPAAGAFVGRLKETTLQKGLSGDPILQARYEYALRESSGSSIYPLRAQQVYTDETGTGIVRTEYTYSWHGTSFQMSNRLTSYPTVPTTQNGSEEPIVESEVFDIYGRTTWRKDARGAISYLEYDLATGALSRNIEDVDTSLIANVPAGWETVPGWGLHLTTDYVNDGLGRVLQQRGPWHEVQLRETDTVATSIRRVLFYAYLDSEHETRHARGYMIGSESPTFQIVGPVDLTRANESGEVTDLIQAVRTATSGPLSAGESFPQSSWCRWTCSVYDAWNRLSARRVYHLIPTSGDGISGTNYLEMVFGYDIMDRQNRVVGSAGTIRRTVYDARGLPVSSWTGTTDVGASDTDPSHGGNFGNNMVKINFREYDQGESGGNGNLSRLTLFTGNDNEPKRIQEFAYDFRDRQISVSQSAGATAFVRETSYDNLDRPLQNSVFFGPLILQQRTSYDVRGLPFLQEVDGIEFGNVVGTLSAQSWYDLGGNLIKASQAGATSFVKTIFDALNRPTISYLACRVGSAGVPTGDDNDVSLDTVVEQNEDFYDAAGDVILTIFRARFHDAIGTGPLQDIDNEPKARVTYSASWPDAIGRTRNTANYGTNGAAAFARPDVAPERADLVLVHTNRFGDDGDASGRIDPMGLETRWENDQAGRRTRLIENYVEGHAELGRISEYTWHASGQIESLTLTNSETGNQATRWVYGTTLTNSNIANNNLLRAKIYPESDDRPAPLDSGPDGVYCRLEYVYNRQEEVVMFRDADATEHQYDYDPFGRRISDYVATFGPNVDEQIRHIYLNYDLRGFLQTVSSRMTAGLEANVVTLAYDAYGNLTEDAQNHRPNDPGTSPKVRYTYADGSANTVRRTSIVYPNGRTLSFQYGAPNSVDDHFNRVSALRLNDEESTLVEYTYVGLAWQVRLDYPQPAVELTYIRQSGDAVGDSGDPYNGYDRFGRTQDLRWQSTSTGNPQLERIQYGFDRNGRRTWRHRSHTTNEDSAYSYDGLSQLTSSALGNLNVNHTAIGGVPQQQEDWAYDSTGNWLGYESKINGFTNLDQVRVHDKGNRLTQIVGGSNPIQLDRVGRMRRVPFNEDGIDISARELVWDAWSRLITIKETEAEGGTEIVRYAYDGLTRRITSTGYSKETVVSELPDQSMSSQSTDESDSSDFSTSQGTSSTTSHDESSSDNSAWDRSHRHFYYSDSWRPVEEHGPGEALPAIQYYWGTRHRDDLVRQDRATEIGGALVETRYVLMDYFSPASITNETGLVTERYRFSAFGIRTIMDAVWNVVTSSEANFEFAFQGQFLDHESGYINYGYRYCSPTLGRWLSKDPLATGGGLNIYAYNSNAPTTLSDYLGLFNSKDKLCTALMYVEHTGTGISAADEAFNATRDSPCNSLYYGIVSCQQTNRTGVPMVDASPSPHYYNAEIPGFTAPGGDFTGAFPPSWVRQHQPVGGPRLPIRPANNGGLNTVKLPPGNGDVPENDPSWDRDSQVCGFFKLLQKNWRATLAKANDKAEDCPSCCKDSKQGGKNEFNATVRSGAGDVMQLLFQLDIAIAKGKCNFIKQPITKGQYSNLLDPVTHDIPIAPRTVRFRCK